MSPHSISFYIVSIVYLTTYILTNSQLASCYKKSNINNPDRSLLKAVNIIDCMCDMLHLVTTIRDQAREIYKKVMEQRSLGRRNQNAICAACVYLACRIENNARSIYEIISVANGATKKQIGQATQFIKRQLGGEGQIMQVKAIHAEDLLPRLRSSFGMNFREMKAAREALQKIEELDIRRTQKTVIATVVYIISQLSNNQRSLKDICSIIDVTEGTIKSSYKDFQPHLVQIIPGWFATEDKIKELKKP